MNRIPEMLVNGYFRDYFMLSGLFCVFCLVLFRKINERAWGQLSIIVKSWYLKKRSRLYAGCR